MKEQAVQTGFDWIGSITHGGPIGMGIMGILTLFSLISWAIILERFLSLGNFESRTASFLEMFWSSKNLTDLSQKAKQLSYSPAREVFFSGYNEMVRVMQAREKKGVGAHVPMDFITVQRALSKAKQAEESGLVKRLGWLAIFASASPFIGLLGTVVGIIRAFQDIATQGSSSLAAVAPGISEALIATALGLVAAIPAAVFYNVFTQRSKILMVKIDGFGMDFLNLLQRHFNIIKEVNQPVPEG